jgi:hypothetical protein
MQPCTVMRGATSTGAVLPSSAWAESDTAAPPSTGSFLWVHLCRRTNIMDTTRWTKHDGVPGGLFSPHPSKLHSHAVLPVHHEHQEGSSIFCVYETSSPMGAVEFAGFLEGPQSPFPYSAYSSKAHHVIMSPITRPPPAHFARRVRGFMQSAWMPTMDDSMRGLATMWETFADAAVHTEPCPIAPPSETGTARVEHETSTTKLDVSPTADAPSDDVMEKVARALPLEVKEGMLKVGAWHAHQAAEGTLDEE